MAEVRSRGGWKKSEGQLSRLEEERKKETLRGRERKENKERREKKNESGALKKWFKFCIV